LELAEEAAERGAHLDDVLVCCSGGGLTAGIALAMEARSPSTKVHSVEPEAFDDYARSLRSGVRERNAQAAGSTCDALLSLEPGAMTFAINKPRLGEGLAVSDAEAHEAVRYAFNTLKIVLEPGGAVALAAVLTGKIAAKGRVIGVIASGGNVDATLFTKILAGQI
jgi:threonine dehydratase